VSARDARTGPARDRSVTGRRPGNASTRPGRAATGNVRSAARRGSGPVEPSGPAAPPDGLVIGAVSPLVRVVGVLLLLAGLAGAIAPFRTYLVVGGEALSQATGFGSVLVAALVPLTHVAVGVGLVGRRVPKFGLAYAGVAGALALGQLLIEIYRGSSSTARPAIEVLAGQRVLTSSVEAGPGWMLGLVALGLTVLAGGCSAAAWGRTVMDDGGELDPARPGLAGAAVVLGVVTVLCLALPAADVPDQLVTDPATGLQTVVTREGPQGLLERPGLALLGGLLLAGALMLCAVVAPSLRPRLAAVGGLLAVTVTVLDAGLLGARDAQTSPDLEWTLPGIGLVMAGLAFVGLTALAWRVRRDGP
jgi:hypothetical protein